MNRLSALLWITMVTTTSFAQPDTLRVSTTIPADTG